MIKQKKLKDYKSYKDVSSMVMFCLKFYGIALLGLLFGGEIGSGNGGWAGIIFGLIYSVGVKIFPILYGVKFVIKKENIFIICGVYFVITYISWILVGAIDPNVQGDLLKSILSILARTFSLTFLTFASGLLAKLIYRPIKISYLESELENDKEGDKV